MVENKDGQEIPDAPSGCTALVEFRHPTQEIGGWTPCTSREDGKCHLAVMRMRHYVRIQSGECAVERNKRSKK